MSRGKRQMVTTGIYKDASGYAVVIRHKGRQLEKRFKFAEVRDRKQLTDHRVAWLKSLQTAKPQRRGFKADIAKYLATFPKSQRKTDARQNLDPWLKAVGDIDRADLTTVRIRTVLNTWTIAASTKNHRRQELLNLFHVLDGKGASNPVRDVPRFREPPSEPRGIPLAAVQAILDKLPDSDHAVRLRVMAATGLPQAQIARLEPRDVDLERRCLYVRPRRKGGGAKAKTLPLTNAAVDALRDFTTRKLFGPFSRKRLSFEFAEAVSNAAGAWQKAHETPLPVPPHVRPYDLRHAFLTEAYRISGDINAVSELALHANPNTTRRYAEGAISETTQRVIDQLNTVPAKH